MFNTKNKASIKHLTGKIASSKFNDLIKPEKHKSNLAYNIFPNFAETVTLRSNQP